MAIFKSEMIDFPNDRRIMMHAFLRDLNAKLAVIEKNIVDEAKKLNEIASLRIKEPGNWLEDFEIHYVISFYLSESDPEYKEGEDNILFTIESCFLKHEVQENFPIFDNEELSESYLSSYMSFNPLHCYLFNLIFLKLGTQWRNIYRIDSFWLSVSLELQSSYEIKPASEDEKKFINRPYKGIQ